jgi:hypothetical protein
VFLAVDAVQAVHTSPVAQSIEAVENALRNPNPQRQTSALPQDKVTISPAAQAKQPASAGDQQSERGGKK